MAQTPAIRVQEGTRCDRIFAADAVQGDVVLVGTIPAVVAHDVDYSEQPIGQVEFDGVFDIPQKAETISGGDAVYWDPTGNPYGGTASSGAATGTPTSYLMGCAAPVQPNATDTTAATDSYVRVKLTAAQRTSTIGGAVTASDIEAEDATLNINGLDAAQGGLVGILGGTSSTASNAGGAATIVGGTGGATGPGGAVAITGGTPGATSGTGGAVSMTGGGFAAGTNHTGGAASVVGGAGKGSGNGGAVAITGGAGGATGAGGALTITSGASAGASGTAGALAIDTGAATGGTGAGITIGGTNATSITLGKMPIIPSATVAADGSAQGDAVAIATGITWVTAADGTKGVKLPTAAAGLVCIVKNDDTANAVLKVYPNTSDTINALSANTAISMAAKTAAVFAAYDATAWFTVPLLPS